LPTIHSAITNTVDLDGANLSADAMNRNGRLKAVLLGDDPASSNNVCGLIVLQIEETPRKVSFRNLWLRKIG
jgi:hypothetical protein